MRRNWPSTGSYMRCSLPSGRKRHVIYDIEILALLSCRLTWDDHVLGRSLSA